MSQAITKRTWWATPIVTVEPADAPALNLRLAEAILEKEREILAQQTPTRVAGVEAGLTAYWLTYNVLHWDRSEIRLLAEMVMSGYDEYRRALGYADDAGYDVLGISCWANVLRHGESLAIHHHDPGFVSAHYTVASGYSGSGPKPNEGGHTIYYRPGFVERSHGDTSFGSLWDDDWRISVPATAGRMTFFPSYVRHEVKTHLGDSHRISIALDIYVKKQRQMPFYFGKPRWFVPEKDFAPATAAR